MDAMSKNFKNIVTFCNNKDIMQDVFFRECREENYMEYCRVQMGCLLIVLYICFIYFRGCMYFIRRRLKNVGSTLNIKTIRGIGYRLELESES